MHCVIPFSQTAIKKNFQKNLWEICISSSDEREAVFACYSILDESKIGSKEPKNRQKLNPQTDSNAQKTALFAWMCSFTIAL
jgi:hypothetical protein